jgi:ribosomal protein S18 acetylase RimI-like enzyme
MSTWEEQTSFRAAATEDIGWLTDTYVVSLRESIAQARGYWDEARERAQFLSQLRLPDTRVFVAQGSPVGFCTLWSEVDHLFLGTLCIAPEHQNKGLGELAMCAIAREAGHLPIRLSVLKSNRAARRFYERLGCYCTSSSAYHDHLVWPNVAMHVTCKGTGA